MEIVKSSINVYDNIIEIVPEDGIKDNSIYEIRLKNVKDNYGNSINKTYNVYTKLSPVFSDINAVRTLIANIEVDDSIILYHIREASRYAEYIKGETIDENNIPFEVSQFVKYRAAHECLLNFSISSSSSGGLTGTVGNVSFSEKESTQDLSDLLKQLEGEIAKWTDAVKGYGNEGRAKMQYAVKGYYKSTLNPPGTISPSVIDFTRGID
jgi:hypothetical protein